MLMGEKGDIVDSHYQIDEGRLIEILQDYRMENKEIVEVLNKARWETARSFYICVGEKIFRIEFYDLVMVKGGRGYNLILIN